jgi:hypothetical protein
MVLEERYWALQTIRTVWGVFVLSPDADGFYLFQVLAPRVRRDHTFTGRRTMV